MAFAQATNIDIEPALAFQELAQVMGDEVANDELRWFRVADQGRAKAWIDLAVGRSDALPPLEAGPREQLQLARPPHRWRCNYAVMLKAASLELNPTISPLLRFEKLVEWMVDDFILAGPAAIFSAMFFSDRARRGGLVKGVRSPDRTKALSGIKNAAWDVTYLSELTRRAMPQSYEEARCIFASADRALAELAPLLLIDQEDDEGFRRDVSSRLNPWWGRNSERVAAILSDAISVVSDRAPPTARPGVDDYVGLKVAEGEALIRRQV